ncbi:MAG: hypothetical protein ACI9C4_002610 [Paraglaciecola sp.]|jgi:hypothetical protein
MKQDVISALCGLLKGEIPPESTPKDWENIIRVARNSAVLSRIAANYYSKFTAPLPHFVVAQFEATNRHSELLKQQVFFEAHELNLHISQCSSQPAIFLKGAAYVLSGAVVGQGRIFSDIDILVNKDDLPKIEKRLLAMAWFPNSIKDYDQKYYREWAHEIPPMVSAGRGTVVDVHHNLIPLISGKAPDINLFLAQLRQLDSGYYVLSAHAMTLHSIIHLFYQEEFTHGFRDLSDLHLLFGENTDNPAFYRDILLLARQTQFCPELYYACRYLQLIFNTAIDDDFLNTLSVYKPGKLRLIIADWMFSRVLLPRHGIVNKPFTSAAHHLGFVRGHWLKMPFHILCIHSFNKVKFAVEHFFTGKNKAQNLPGLK